MTRMQTSRSVAAHEAAHCASLIMNGLTPLWCRCDAPTQRLAGSVGLDWDGWEVDDRTLRAILVALLQGPAADGELKSDWPVNPDDWDDASRLDAEQISFISEVLALDAVDWHFVLFQVQKQGRDHRYRRLLVAIAQALEDHELLFRPELERIMQEAQCGNG
jgi:hypothetical protein